MDFKKEGKIFDKKGISIINDDIDSKFLPKIREDLELEFANHNFPRELDIDKFQNKELKDQILNLIPTKKIKLLFNEISNINNSGPITLFPFANVMRNYYSGPFVGLHGWHSDSDGELKYKYCKERMKSKKYIFGKLQICFQANNEYGGNIDVLSEHYIKGLNRTPLKIKIFLKLQNLFVKSKYLRKKYFKNTWISDIFAHLMRFEKIMTKPISVIIFEHRLFHRGTPMKPDIFFALRKKHGNEIINNQYQINPEINLRSKNKYTFYIHFGSEEGLLSYLYDRVRREFGDKEIKRWKKQYQEIGLLKKDFPESEIIFKKNLKKII